jgi:hypothetical protein
MCILIVDIDRPILILSYLYLILPTGFSLQVFRDLTVTKLVMHVFLLLDYLTRKNRLLIRSLKLRSKKSSYHICQLILSLLLSVELLKKIANRSFS